MLHSADTAQGATRRRRVTRLIALLGVAALVWLASPVKAGDLEAAQVVIYLDIPANIKADITLSLRGMALVGDGDTVPLQPITPRINSVKRSGQQFRLAEQNIMPDRYRFLHLDFESIEGLIGKAPVQPQPPSGGVDIPVALDLISSETRLVVISWPANAIQSDQASYRPEFRVKTPEISPVGSQVFISNEDSGYLTVVDRFSNNVVDLLRVGEGPRGMAYSSLAQQLFVANSQSNSVSVIDGLSHRIIKTILLRFGDDPSRLVLSPDESMLYVLNYGSNSLSVVDARSLQEISRIAVGDRPRGITTDRITGQVFVASELSDDIYVYDPVTRSVVKALALASSPREICYNDRTRQLYLSGTNQRAVSVFNTETGSTVGAINLCSPATGLVCDYASDRLYVALPGCSEIAILRPDKELEIGNIELPSAPGLLTFDPAYRQLLAVMPEAGQLAIYNTNSHKLTGLINVGVKPYMAVVSQ